MTDWPHETREDGSDTIERGGHPSEKDLNKTSLPKVPPGPGPGSDVGTKSGGGSGGDDQPQVKPMTEFLDDLINEPVGSMARAACLHGIVCNTAYTTEERLEAAIEALDVYSKRIEELEPEAGEECEVCGQPWPCGAEREHLDEEQLRAETGAAPCPE